MPRKKRKKTRSKKEPFWKKIKNPELQRLAEHIGKITDNTSWKDFADLFLMLAITGLGWQASNVLGIKDLKTKISVALSAPVAYKLATSPNLIAGASGTVYLATLGLIDVWNPLTGAYESGMMGLKKTLQKAHEEYPEWIWWPGPYALP